jgi:N utilization substance protein B
MKTAKRQAREIALQALYAWQLSGGDPVEEARSLEDFDKIDPKFVEALLRGVLERSGELEQIITPHLDRQFKKL